MATVCAAYMFSPCLWIFSRDSFPLYARDVHVRWISLDKLSQAKWVVCDGRVCPVKGGFPPCTVS